MDGLVEDTTSKLESAQVAERVETLDQLTTRIPVSGSRWSSGSFVNSRRPTRPPLRRSERTRRPVWRE